MARATLSADRRLPPHGNNAATPDTSHIIDLTSPASASAGDDCFERNGRISLGNLIIGERLGATRDGGEGYQVR